MKRFASWAFALGLALVAVLYGRFVAELPFGAAMLLLALGGLTVAFCALALVRMVDPLIRGDKAIIKPEPVQQSVRLRELEHDKALVLKAIREIEHDFQMRKIGEADYRELSQRYRARALRLIQDIDAGDDFRTLIEDELKARLKLPPPAAGSGQTAGPAGRACKGCGTTNDQDAEFCKKCGQALKPVASSNAS